MFSGFCRWFFSDQLVRRLAIISVVVILAFLLIRNFGRGAIEKKDVPNSPPIAPVVNQKESAPSVVLGDGGRSTSSLQSSTSEEDAKIIRIQRDSLNRKILDASELRKSLMKIFEFYSTKLKTIETNDAGRRVAGDAPSLESIMAIMNSPPCNTEYLYSLIDQEEHINVMIAKFAKGAMKESEVVQKINDFKTSIAAMKEKVGTSDLAVSLIVSSCQSNASSSMTLADAVAKHYADEVLDAARLAEKKRKEIIQAAAERLGVAQAEKEATELEIQRVKTATEVLRLKNQRSNSLDDLEKERRRQEMDTKSSHRNQHNVDDNPSTALPEYFASPHPFYIPPPPPPSKSPSLPKSQR